MDTPNRYITADTDRRNLINEYKGMSVDSIREDMRKHAFSLHVAIENFQHDFNIGAVVRNANAFNVAGVHIIGRRHWNRRGAMATEKYLILYHHADVDSFIDWVVSAKLRLIGVDNVRRSIELSSAELPQKAVYVFGQEGPGLSEKMKERVESIVAIEQFGSTRSINVGVASGIVLYEWVRRNHIIDTKTH